ncbi:MAG TPA: hypothetical protein VKS79_13805, partial [Gemmataceae bacterium]|nr:hypothetical protein [Gemmataceae bacterium]
NGSFVTSPVPNQIFQGVHPTPDPLAYLPPPSMPPDGTMTKTAIGNGNFQYTLSPGTYTNLPTFNKGDVVILQQASANSNGGIYYINGGGFKSTGATVTMDPLTSGGVLIYNQPASSANSEKIQITGNASGIVDLAPLQNGPYSGIMLWQDRNSAVPMQIDGNGTFTLRGTLYAAGALMNVTGNGGQYAAADGSIQSGSAVGSQYITKDLGISGNGNVLLRYPGMAAPTRILTLVE